MSAKRSTPEINAHAKKRPALNPCPFCHREMARKEINEFMAKIECSTCRHVEYIPLRTTHVL